MQGGKTEVEGSVSYPGVMASIKPKPITPGYCMAPLRGGFSHIDE